MATYSVADAKNALPKLIDRALEGEEVIISRHGKAVVELRPAMAGVSGKTAGSYTWLQVRRRGRNGVGLSSVELLNQLYDEREISSC